MHSPNSLETGDCDLIAELDLARGILELIQLDLLVVPRFNFRDEEPFIDIANDYITMIQDFYAKDFELAILEWVVANDLADLKLSCHFSLQVG